jgi:uncharacterized protein (UPF0333 family)
MNKKGQAAMEFLMTYGWAILVVLAAIGALAYFGVLNPSKLIPNKCTLSPGFDFTDCKSTAGTGMQLTLHNGLGADTTATYIYLDTTGSSDVTCNDELDVGTLANGATSDPITLCLVNATDFVENSRFDANVKIVYTKSGESLNYTVTGTINRKIES